eukprot:TRINITY_DN293_c0_g5_i1.p1 TRINITY_DN293_c0_g5~~TRINITY_DN293_c0_g5_i1.p1  ORF type:complete len:464 (-),score=144.34 TRINITY_DN293_c0_g5_i1:1131-2522(-)
MAEEGAAARTEALDSLIDETEAASRIQKAWRTRMEKKEKDFHDKSSTIDTTIEKDAIDEDIAASRIQALVRGKNARKKTSQMREDKAATAIQARWRGHNERKKLGALETESSQRGENDVLAAPKEPIGREMQEDDLRTQLERQYERDLSERERLLERNMELHRLLMDHFQRKGDEKTEDDMQHVIGDFDERYRRYLERYRELCEDQDHLESDFDSVASEMRSRLEERRERASEFRKSFRTFRSEIADGAEFSRSGKVLGSKGLEELEEEEGLQNEQVIKERLEFIRLTNQLKSLEQKLKQKEKLADGLHLIDFEQLKIENQALNEKIEERNEELAKLKKKNMTTVHVLTHVKEKLQFVQQENQALKKELAEIELEVTEHRDTITRAKAEREKLKGENSHLKDSMPLIGNVDLLIDYERKTSRIAEVLEAIEHFKARHDDLADRLRNATIRLGDVEQANATPFY